jgi:hypothetical protein
LSESFRLAAADAEEMAGAFAASADALKAKAAESLQRMADGAQTARDAWDGLTGSGSGRQCCSSGSPFHRGGRCWHRGHGQGCSQSSQRRCCQGRGRPRCSREPEKLRAEYEQLIASGNLDAAGRKLQEIAKAQRAAAGSAVAAQSTALLEQAYKDLGMTTNEDLQRMATQARAAFDR